MNCNTPCEYEEGIVIIPPEYPEFECDCEAMEAAINQKQDKLTAGENITIDENNVISSTGGGASYTAGTNIQIENDEISAPNVYSKTETEELLDSYATKNELDAVEEKADTAQTDADTALAGVAQLEVSKQDVLTAGDYITISPNGTISGNYTKNDILDILGYSEIPITLEDLNDSTLSITVLGVRNNG